MSHATDVSVIDAPRLAPGRRFSLSMMMFLQYAIWGAWFTVIFLYMTRTLQFSGAEAASVMGTMALGTIIAPLFIGQIADRYFSSEKLMGLLHLAGAALLYAMAEMTTFLPLYVAALVYALVYSPTLVLSNSITFAHVPDGGRDFPRIRVFGTIGWIVAGLVVGQILSTFFPGANATNKPLFLAAGFSAVLGIFSFFLPHTPPPGKTGDAFPALRAIGLLRSPSFAVFFGVSFVITIVLAFYYSLTSDYLDASTLAKIAKLPPEGLQYEINLGFRRIPLLLNPETVMTIGQFAEMILLPFLPWFLRKMGMKWVLAMGMAAWGIRYFLFALGDHDQVGPWTVIASLALHGVCFDFFFAAGFIYVDQEAPSEIRASGQALFTFLTYGVGMWIGTQISGVVRDSYLSAYHYIPAKNWLVPSPFYDWYHIWIIPSIGVVASLVIFALFFRMEPEQKV